MRTVLRMAFGVNMTEDGLNKALLTPHLSETSHLRNTLAFTPTVVEFTHKGVRRATYNTPSLRHSLP